MSNSVQSMPSSMPICEPKPSDSNIVKNNTAQNGAPGNSTMACVNTINASPVPSAACKFTKNLTQLSIDESSKVSFLAPGRGTGG